ncbi:MAG: type II secretion system ATPase GspE [Thermodesulfovibrionia bacterium]|nr:type II secretion system ATPase GspE [Thermodesulfovibrionia bacterium]
MEIIDGIEDEEIEFSLLHDLPLSFVKGNLFLPLKRQDGELLAAVSDNRGISALRDLARNLGLKPHPVMANKEMILNAINRIYSRTSTVDKVMGDIRGEDLSMIATEFESPKDLLELTEEAPITRLINALLLEAVKERASDIHIEPYEKGVEVRLRVDGILRRILSPPKIVQEALISRVKIIANLDIAEKRLPQDGRIKLLVGGKDIDIRVSIIPTALGERAVLRLLDRQAGVMSLEALGLTDSILNSFKEALARQNGIILVTGPTGSGKTTTLYGSLLKLNTEERNIITVEDPVEYQLTGIGQMHVNPKIGLTFASGLRAILRQDPDIMMVGEIRDLETAEIAVHASLTGHLVLSTLHTNDAPSALTRLIDMGIEPFLVASSLVCVLAQRLVRVICPHCKESYVPTAQEIAYLNLDPPPVSLYRGRGCDKCLGKGYLGRTGIYELLEITPEVRKMTVERKDAQSIRSRAMSAGFKVLKDNAVQKVMRGITTIEEVLRVTQKDIEE